MVEEFWATNNFAMAYFSSSIKTFGLRGFLPVGVAVDVAADEPGTGSGAAVLLLELPLLQRDRLKY